MPALSKESADKCSLGKIEQILPIKVVLRDDDMCRNCRCAHQTLSCIRSVFEQYGLKRGNDVNMPLLKAFSYLHELSARDLLIDYLKFKCSYIFSWGTDQEKPKCPDSIKKIREEYGDEKDHVLVGGTYYAFQVMMKNYELDRDYKRGYGFFYSLLMAKKGMPRACEGRLEDAVRSAYETMTKPRERSFSSLMVIEAVKKRVQEIVGKLFRKERWDNVKMCFPSQSAHRHSKRNQGGAVGTVRNDGLLPDPREFDSVSNVYEMALKGVIRITSFSLVEDDELIEQEEISRRLKINPSMPDNLIRAQFALLQRAMGETPSCIPVALAEPLKIRVVTCGPEYLYASMMPVQKMLFRTLARDDRFCVDAPITEKRIKKTLGRLSRKCKFLSGDYKAATDNIAIELSYAAVDAIAKETGMPETYRTLFRRSLVEHFYTYKEDGQIMPYLPQARGQLMGSPTSFPILCLINFALIWEACYPLAPFRKVRVMVNGDDCLFQCTEEERLRWVEYAEYVGLTPSVGKTYYSADFVVMNSELYLLRETDGDMCYCWKDAGEYDWEYVPYLNMGLLSGQNKNGEITTAAIGDEKSLGAKARALIRGFSNKQANEILSVFIENNVKDLKTADGRPCCIPWFVDERWGGLGLPWLGGPVSIEEKCSLNLPFDSVTARVVQYLMRRDASVRQHPDPIRCDRVVIPSIVMKDPLKSEYFDRISKFLGDYYGYRVASDDETFAVGDLLWGQSRILTWQLGFENTQGEYGRWLKLFRRQWKAKAIMKVDKFWRKMNRKVQTESSCLADFDLKHYNRGPAQLIPNVYVRPDEGDLTIDVDRCEFEVERDVVETRCDDNGGDRCWKSGVLTGAVIKYRDEPASLDRYWLIKTVDKDIVGPGVTRFGERSIDFSDLLAGSHRVSCWDIDTGGPRMYDLFRVCSMNE